MQARYNTGSKSYHLTYIWNTNNEQSDEQNIII